MKQDVTQCCRRVPARLELRHIAPEPGGAADEVSVRIKLEGVEGRFGIAGQQRTWRSGVFDLRLFRDGQLVRQVPDLGDMRGGERSTAGGLGRAERRTDRDGRPPTKRWQ